VFTGISEPKLSHDQYQTFGFPSKPIRHSALSRRLSRSRNVERHYRLDRRNGTNPSCRQRSLFGELGLEQMERDSNWPRFAFSSITGRRRPFGAGRAPGQAIDFARFTPASRAQRPTSRNLAATIYQLSRCRPSPAAFRDNLVAL